MPSPRPLALALLLSALVAPAASASGPDDRYALVHGCYGLRSGAVDRFVAKAPGGGYAAGSDSVASAEPIRMQATDLGSYLLYGKAGDFLAADSGDAPRPRRPPRARPRTGGWRATTAGSR